MKTVMPLLVFAAGLFPLSGFAQLSNGGIYAKFGIDADTRSNYVKYGPLTGVIVSDDWFSPSGTGNNVIDTSNSASYLSLLQAGTNITFSERMSALLYAKIGGKLWLDAAYGRDYTAASSLKDSTTFTTASKNGDNPVNWQGGVSNFPNKNDLVDVYAHMRRDGQNVHDSLWLFTAASTYGTTGSSYFDVELYKDTFYYTPSTGKFTSGGTDAGHTQWVFDAAGNITQTGDMILAVNFSPGLAPVVDLRIWVSQTTVSTVIPTYFNFTGSFDGATNAPSFGYASIVSKSGTTAWGGGISNYSTTATQDTTYATPWGTGSPAGGANWAAQYQSEQLVEIGLNLTRVGVDPALYSALSPCQSLFSNIFFKSRSSNSFTSNMQDFVTPLTFLRSPIMDYSLNGDTLRCNHQVATISISNNTTAGYYSWQTVQGRIARSNSDSSRLTIAKAGTYIVSASPAQGCPATRTDTVVVPIDTFPPVATAAAGLSGDQLDLYGGDPIASNYPTPFGGSKGLTYSWTGPDGFTASIQDPTTDTVWGTYKITVTENRNGCTDTASVPVSAVLFGVLQSNGLVLAGRYTYPSVQLRWQDPAASRAGSYVVERMDEHQLFQFLGTVEGASSCLCYTDDHPFPGDNSYRIKAAPVNGDAYYSATITIAAGTTGQSYYLAGDAAIGMKLVANTGTASPAILNIYGISGQLLQKQPVTLYKGANYIPIPATAGGQKMAQVIVLFIGDKLVFAQKAFF